MNLPKYGLDFEAPKPGKKTRVVERFTDNAVKLANSMPKEDWQRIKHMGKIEMCVYIQAVYNKGFRDGVASQQRTVTKTPIEKPAEEPPAADPGGEPDELGD